jgi:hypothetical protein
MRPAVADDVDLEDSIPDAVMVLSDSVDVSGSGIALRNSDKVCVVRCHLKTCSPSEPFF